MELKQDQQINQKVEILKTDLKRVMNNHFFEIYKILKDIMKLRQEQIEGYGIKDLHKEKNLDLTDEQIRYYMGFDHVSERTQGLIDGQKIGSSTVLWILRKSMEFRNPETQALVIDKYIKGELTSSVISHTASEELVKKVKQEFYDASAEDIGMKICYRMKEVLKYLETNKDVLTSKKINHLINNEASKIVDLVDSLEGNDRRVLAWLRSASKHRKVKA